MTNTSSNGRDPSALLRSGASPVQLPTLGIFERLSPEVQAQLVERGQLVIAPPSAPLNSVGDPCEGLSLILSGHVRVEQMDALGWEAIATMGAGDLIGARGWSTRQLWRERISAIDEARLLFLPQAELSALTAQYPELQRQLERYAERHRLHALLGAHPVFQGVSHQALLRLVDLASLRYLRPDDILFSPQLILAFLFVIGQGEVELSVDDEPLVRLSRGELLNLEFALHDTPPLATARATQPTTLYMLPFDEVEQLLEESGRRIKLAHHAHQLRSRIFNE